MVLEKTFEGPLDYKEIQLVQPKGNRSWIFTGRTDAEAKAPTLWPPDVKRLLIGKYPDAGKDGRQEEKGMTEDEMVGWHHWLDGHEFEQTLGDGERQRSLVCCISWGHKELVTTWQKTNNRTFIDLTLSVEETKVNKKAISLKSLNVSIRKKINSILSAR